MEIVSVDSALVYSGMDVGTAKPSPQTLREVRHHLIDIRDPSERYSAGAFRRDALAAMTDIRSRGRIPLLVGGTLLYFKALTEGLASLPAPDAAIRASLDEQAALIGWPAMHGRLEAVDPEAASRIHPNDSQRIQRALEVYQQTGRPLSAAQSEHAENKLSDTHYLRISLVPDSRTELNKIIERRLNGMIKRGFLDEVSRLRARDDLTADLPALRAVGYRQLWQHLDGETELEEAMRRALVATRRLAKRQMTWLRSEAVDAVVDPFSGEPATKVRDIVTEWLGQQRNTL